MKNTSVSCKIIIGLSMNFYKRTVVTEYNKVYDQVFNFTQINDEKIINTETEKLCNYLNIDPSNSAGVRSTKL